MKDNNLTHKFWARAVAFCLFCVMTAILACCIAGVVYCYSKEWYKTGLNVTFTTEGDEWDYAIDGTNAIMTDKTGFKEFAYKNRNSMMVYGFIAGITALACFVFLLCSAGAQERYRGLRAAAAGQDAIRPVPALGDPLGNRPVRHARGMCGI